MNPPVYNVGIMYSTDLSRDQIKKLRRAYLRSRNPVPPQLKAAWDAVERRRLDVLSRRYAKKREAKASVLASPPETIRTFRNGILLRKPVPRAPKVALPMAPADPQIAAFYASHEWRYLRYDTIRHYGAKCQCCNRTPEEHGIVLHVDHIVPLRKDWSRRLDRTNTQVLCEECNQGKGSRHSDDWRRKKTEPFKL